MKVWSHSNTEQTLRKLLPSQGNVFLMQLKYFSKMCILRLENWNHMSLTISETFKKMTYLKQENRHYLSKS